MVAMFLILPTSPDSPTYTLDKTFQKGIFERAMALIELIVLLPIFLFASILVKIKIPDRSILHQQKKDGKRGVDFRHDWVPKSDCLL